MLPENRIPTHPGEILLEEFLNPLGLTQVAFAGHIGVPVQRINEIVRGKRGITPETAWLFSEAFGTSPEFWLNLRPQMAAAAADSGAHVCLRAAGPAAVDAFHAAALAAGGTSDGAPGLRPQHGQGYYAAFIRDADGNRIEAVTFPNGDLAF